MTTEYQIEVKQTSELSSKEWSDYTYGFNNVFKKNFTSDYFKNKYFKTSLGYSIHGILFHKDKIVGMFTAIPRQYIINNHEITIGLGCDAFILKEHRRDEYFLKQMADVVTSKLGNMGINHFISIPNKNAYPYWIYYGSWKDIGKLNYYVLPLKVSKLLGKYKFIDFFTFYSLKLVIAFFAFFCPNQKKQSEKIIHLKQDQKYLSERYNSEYLIRKVSDNFSFIYRIYNEGHVRTAYLIECIPLSKSNITTALNQIIDENGQTIDIVMYIGIIDNPPFFLIKVPEKKEPRIQRFIGFTIDNSFDKDFFSINSWEIGLANFDNR